MSIYHEAKEILERALEDVVRKGEVTSSNLDILDKLTHAIKSVDTINAMEKRSYAEDSFDNEPSRTYGHYYGAKRDRMGRYSRDEKNELVAEMHELKKMTSDEHIKRKIDDLIAELR